MKLLIAIKLLSIFLFVIFIFVSCKSTEDELIIKEIDDNSFYLNKKVLNASVLIKTLERRNSNPKKIEYIGIKKYISKEQEKIILFLKKKYHKSKTKLFFKLPVSINDGNINGKIIKIEDVFDPNMLLEKAHILEGVE